MDSNHELGAYSVLVRSGRAHEVGFEVSIGAAGLPFVPVQNISGTNYLTLTFNGVATDVTYTVQASSDLTGAWTTIHTYPSGGTAPGTVTVQDTQAITVSPKRFMRLLMTNP